MEKLIGIAVRQNHFQQAHIRVSDISKMRQIINRTPHTKLNQRHHHDYSLFESKNSPPPSPSFYTSYSPCHWSKQDNTSRTGLFFYALSRRNSVGSKLLQTNPLNFLHFPANPALLGSLERRLYSRSIKQVRHMMYRGLEGGKSEANRRKERTSERERSCLQTLRVVLYLYWALQGSNV